MENITYYTVYKVTNKVNGKIYIGCHKTTNLDDGYMGSGKYLKRAIEKHGLYNFEKEILFVYDNPEDMFSKEKELVNEDFLAEENTYNLKVGGFGGWDYANINYDVETRKKNLKAANPAYIKRFNNDKEFRLMCIEQLKSVSHLGRKDSFLGKAHTEESKKKMSESKKGQGLGKNNSQYGTRWIHSLKEKRSKKLRKTDPLPEGWNEGRKLKFS